MRTAYRQLRGSTLRHQWKGNLACPAANATINIRLQLGTTQELSRNLNYPSRFNAYSAIGLLFWRGVRGGLYGFTCIHMHNVLFASVSFSNLSPMERWSWCIKKVKQSYPRNSLWRPMGVSCGVRSASTYSDPYNWRQVHLWVSCEVRSSTCKKGALSSLTGRGGLPIGVFSVRYDTLHVKKWCYSRNWPWRPIRVSCEVRNEFLSRIKIRSSGLLLR
jgi:hypothetical protein